MNAKRERDIGLDVVKAVAAIFVVCVHFFYNTRFYQTAIIGENMYMQVALQQVFLSCVPLFMIATGYINKNTNISIKYYKKLIPILVTYLLYSILALIIKYKLDGEVHTLESAIVSILSFQANPYSWYINMFFGLFIMAPFLNILYNNLSSKQDKKVLLGIFLLLTAIPVIFNGRFLGILYLPAYFIGMYPITYYFIGKYISEYKPNINVIYGVIAFILVIVVQAYIEIYYAEGAAFKFYLLDYQSILRTFQSVVLFLLLCKVKVSNNILKSFVILISTLSLDIYLSSYAVDRVVYSYFNQYGMTQTESIYFFLPIVVIVFIISLLISYLRKTILNIR